MPPAKTSGHDEAQSEPDATDQRFPLCISEQAQGRDFDATLRFRFKVPVGKEPNRLRIYLLSRAEDAEIAFVTDGAPVIGKRPARSP